ncbi:ABC transporter ATP-binding protein [Reyranella sp. CPCC 100927]|uniref:ABC transporter ATP-binding protein n=1 Tax=Reyranella sp. CPCC 100927 TaxID=2599616 RepID=UPI0011B83F04|nr:ABC transporter ATP-binding protein [Reyranella sp. CPCC 100927]TWT11596.1 ABC transporter ATP-binding protein [Reyranella sp. CPCC 100927]
MSAAPILSLSDITTVYGGGKRAFGGPRAEVRAVDGVSLELREGEALGLVGESGCGKTTLAKTILGLLTEKSGSIRLGGQVVSGLRPEAARRARPSIHYVHQDPGAALDPWWTVGHALDETLRIHGVRDRRERAARIAEMLMAVGLDTSFLSRYPHELSGGQQRRIGLARILTLRPRIVILDEPTSGLDLSVQATVLGLFNDLRHRLGLTYLFVSHDLSVVRRMCDRVAIMYLGRIVEIGPTAQIFAAPAHHYTRALLAASPTLTPGSLDDMPSLRDDPPSPTAVPSGCAFRTRCAHADEQCRVERPDLAAVTDTAHGHLAACHHAFP